MIDTMPFAANKSLRFIQSHNRQEEMMRDLTWQPATHPAAPAPCLSPNDRIPPVHDGAGYDFSDFRKRLRSSQQIQDLRDLQKISPTPQEFRPPAATSKPVTWTFESWGEYLSNTVFKVMGAGASAAGAQVFRDLLLGLCKHPLLRTAGIVLPSAMAMLLEQMLSDRLQTRTVGNFDPHMNSRVLVSSVNNWVRKTLERSCPHLNVFNLSLLRAAGIGGVGALRGLHNQLDDMARELRNGGTDLDAPRRLKLEEMLTAVVLGASVRACLEVPKQFVKAMPLKTKGADLAQKWIQTPMLFPTPMSAVQQSVACATASKAAQSAAQPKDSGDPGGAPAWTGLSDLMLEPLSFPLD